MVWCFYEKDNNVNDFRQFSGIAQLIFPSILFVLLFKAGKLKIYSWIHVKCGARNIYDQLIFRLDFLGRVDQLKWQSTRFACERYQERYSDSPFFFLCKKESSFLATRKKGTYCFFWIWTHEMQPPTFAIRQRLKVGGSIALEKTVK